MIIWKIGDIFASLPLICFWAILFMKFQEKKYELKKSFAILVAACAVLYFLVDRMPKEAFLQKEMIQAVAVIGISLFFVDGESKRKWRGAGFIYLWMLSMDFSVFFVMWILGTILTQNQWQYAEIMLGKNIYNLLIYIIFVFYKLFQGRKNQIFNRGV